MYDCALVVLKYILEVAGPYEPKLEYMSTFEDVLKQFQNAGAYANSDLYYRGERFPMKKVTEAEKIKLIHFYNMIKTSTTLFDNLNGKRKRTMAISARVTEGPEAKYISGSGMTDATRRRVTIFEQISSKSEFTPLTKQ